MEEPMPLSLALLDFLPNLAFLVGMIALLQLVRREKDPLCLLFTASGGLLIFVGAFLKAVWKLHTILTGAGYEWMSNAQFFLLAPGFFLLLIGVIRLARQTRQPAPVLLAILPWKIPFIIVMTLCSMGVHGIMTYVSFRKANRWAAAGYITAFLCLIAMGALSSGEQTVARQWLEESVNSIGQIGFAFGSILLARTADKEK